MQYGNPEAYREVTETTVDPIFKAQMVAEADIIRRVPDASSRCYIDLGAGAGRLLPIVVPIFRSVVAIEISSSMYATLVERARMFPIVQLIRGDITRLPDLDVDYERSVIGLVQNSLGTIEGDYRAALDGMRVVGMSARASIVLSLFRAQALESWGVALYTSAASLTGFPDFSRCDFENGRFVSTTGYVSKWWTDEDIERIIRNLGVRVEDEIRTKEWVVMRLEFIQS